MLAQHYALHMRRVRKHGQNHITAFADFLVRSSLRPACDNFFHGGGIQVVDQQVGVASFQNVLRHGFSHNSKPDQPNFHSISLQISNLLFKRSVLRQTRLKWFS